MFFIDELKDLRIYRKEFLLPLNEKDKKKNSMAILMGTNIESAVKMMKYEHMNPKYYMSYYLERAAMYYINQEAGLELDGECVVTESIEDVLDNNAKIVYKGYQHDINTVKMYFNKNTIDRLSADYRVRIKYPITVNIVGRSGKRENTANQVWMLSPSTYNTSLKSYEMYVYYNVMEIILLNANKNIPVEYKYAMALYDSGLYDLHKDNWIFGHRLKAICKNFERYEKEHGHKSLARKVASPDFKDILIDNLPGVLISDLNKLFGESADIVSSHENADIIQLNSRQVLGMPITEDSSYNAALKRTLYQDRFKTLEELKAHYDKMKASVPYIKYTYNIIEKYRGLNLFVDLSHYMYSYYKNATIKRERGYKIFNEMIDRLINDKRYAEQGYTKKSIIIPIDDWITDVNSKMWMINTDINPISCIYHSARTNPGILKKIFGDSTVIFISNRAYFKINFETVAMDKVVQLFARNIRLLADGSEVIPNEDDDARESSPKAITVDLVDKLEKAQGIDVNDISAMNKDDSDKNKISVSKEDDKKKLVQTIAKAAETNSSEDDVMDDLDQSDDLKEIIANLSAEADEKSNISDARASRMIKLQNDIMDKKFKDKSIRQLTQVDYDHEELREKSIPVDSVNEEWKQLKSPTQEDIYDMDSDIVQIFNQFSDKTYPLATRDIKVEDNSTSEYATMLYTVSYESADGKRFSIKADIPKWIDNKYMILGGNKKDLPNQLFLMPISKTDDDTVQIVSNYNKIFIRRFGTTTGKSFIVCDRLIKTINKNQFKSLKVDKGDNTKICNKYELPIDYIDFASVYNKLSTPSTKIYFNQDELRRDYGDKIDEKLGIPIGVQGNTILYYNSIIGKDKEFMSFSHYLLLLLETDKDLSKEGIVEAYKSTSRSVRYTYSRASILNTVIPVIVICAYSEGLTKTLKKGNIVYRMESSKRSIDDNTEDFIKFNDGYLIYKLDYASSLLMNGLKACPTSDYSIGEIDSKSMYLDFLDGFGGRILADRLDNFYNLMIDKPITYRALEYYNLPTDYNEVLLYANRLLADNKFNKHTNLTNNRRIRRQEQVAAILYSELSSAYGQYCINMKHGRYAPMSMKQTAVTDAILSNSTTSDKSIINALGEYEAYASVTPKGPSGMNSDRSYTLDKRAFDASMLNMMGMSTGFAGNVGINRQLTIDANISTARGYVKDTPENIDSISPTKTLCMTEAMTPFGSTRDDPFRTAMTFIQTSKHGIRCKRSNPNLITSGADEALPYMISNIFAYKAKDNGVVKEINEDRMIIQYDNGEYEYVDLSEKIEKNSSSGFYVTLKLDTDLKEGKRVKAGDIVAYDRDSFSSDFGANDNLAYSIGTFCKFAILNTDEGFEDSAIISEDLSDAMTSDIVLQIDKVFDKNTDIFNMVSKGQSIEEGDVLLVAQASYDEEDVNTLLRNLTADDEDDITELGRIPIKSKVTGVVQDIKIYRTVELDELSPTLKKIVSKYEKDIEVRKKEMKKYGIENIETTLSPTGKLPPTGRLKNVDNGVKIEFYLKYEDRMSVGDKLIYYSANKGVVKDIFPRGKEPRSYFRPNEKIHTLLSSGSVDGRMVCSIMVNGGINKGLVELSRKCKDMLGIKYNDDLFT